MFSPTTMRWKKAASFFNQARRGRLLGSIPPLFFSLVVPLIWVDNYVRITSQAYEVYLLPLPQLEEKSISSFFSLLAFPQVGAEVKFGGPFSFDPIFVRKP